MRPDPTISPEAPQTGDGAAGAPQQPGSCAPGKPKRKAIPARVMVSVAIRQAGGVRCPLCAGWIDETHQRILEHMTPHATRVALGLDPDDQENLRFVHAECASRKTNGTKATTAGSDKHMIAKAVRFDKINRGERSRTRKGPPLKSRPFPKVHRPMRRPQP